MGNCCLAEFEAEFQHVYKEWLMLHYFLCHLNLNQHLPNPAIILYNQILLSISSANSATATASVSLYTYYYDYILSPETKYS